MQLPTQAQERLNGAEKSSRIRARSLGIGHFSRISNSLRAGVLMAMASAPGCVIKAERSNFIPNSSSDAGGDAGTDGNLGSDGGTPVHSNFVGTASLPSGQIVVSVRGEKEDGGSPQGSDAGIQNDAGVLTDGGMASDGGENTADAGDAGKTDAGKDDAGDARTDAGSLDAGEEDAGTPDPDAGLDAGTPDAGTPDAGTEDCEPQACTVGVGACASTGEIIFDANCNLMGCTALPGFPAEQETCGNGSDDDCNEAIDDGCTCNPGDSQPCYSGSEITRHIGACRDGILMCAGTTGAWATPCQNEQSPRTEVCGNSTDEDCDGETNENCGGGQECAVGEGACRRSGITRPDGSCDAVPGQPAERETCGNGTDDDCQDGIDDGCICEAEETQDCYQGDPATRNVPPCTDGSQTCIDGQFWSACDGQVLPSQEECDGTDNNCNHAADEGCPCEVGQGACRRIGERLTDGDCGAVAGEPGTETCNGVDDDCNGETDDTFPGQGQPCEVGTGECHREGEIVCTDPKLGAHCSVDAGEPDEEQCNRVDDDCDTITDEGCPCSSGRGVCQAHGTIQETNGQCNAVEHEPQPEICNGLDDNCNGPADETFPEQGRSCEIGVGECEQTGEIICEPGSPAGDTHCGAIPGNPNPEACNGLDDDCNGSTDTHPTTGAAITQTCQSCASQTCSSGQWGPCGPDADPNPNGGQGDGIADCRDNCTNSSGPSDLYAYNPDQQDANRNGIGDRCDSQMFYLGCEGSPVSIQVGNNTTRSGKKIYFPQGVGNMLVDGALYHNICTNPTGNDGGPYVYFNSSVGTQLQICYGPTSSTAADLANGPCFTYTVQ